MRNRISYDIKFKRKNNHIFNFNQLVSLLETIFLIIYPIKAEKSSINIISNYSEINMIILGSGNQSILNDSYYLEPSMVIVNGIIREECKKFCEFYYEENNVTLYFNNSVVSCEHMFDYLENITKIDLSKFDFSCVTSMAYMFRGCYNLEKINFGEANTSSVKEMKATFNHCEKLSLLNLSSFDTSSVTTMEELFYYCTNLLSINVSNFNTKNVETLRIFFYKCEKLTLIDISNFDTPKVTSFQSIFANCTSLEMVKLGDMNTSSLKNMQGFYNYCLKIQSIDLSSFDTSLVTSIGWLCFHCYEVKYIILSEKFKTSNVINMKSTFSHCKKLVSLNLSSFDTSKVTDMSYMFNNCQKLKYLDISNFSPLNITTIVDIFNNMRELIYLNIKSFEYNNETDVKDAFKNPRNNLKICASQPNMVNLLSSLHLKNNCSDVCFEKDIKIGYNSTECIYSCKDKGFNYENGNICYEQCPLDAHVILNDINNKDNIFTEYDDGVAKCFYRPEGYFLDEDGFYEKCFENCIFCYGPGNITNNNCIKCKIGYLFFSESIYPNNCYLKCENYYYFDRENNYICTEECSGLYNKTIINKKKCIDKCENDDIYKFEYNNSCYAECPNGTIYNNEESICFEEKIFETTILDNKGLTTIISTPINIITSEIIQTSDSTKFINTTNNINNSVIFQNIDLTTIIKTPTNINNSNIYQKAYFSTILNEIDESTNNVNSDIFSTSFNNKDIKIIQTNNEIMNTYIMSFSSKNFINSEFIYKTNFIITGNNIEVYRGVQNYASQNYDILKDGEIVFKTEEDFIFLLTNTQKELEHLKENNKTNRFSIIDLGECENILKRHYQINENVSLIIIKFEKISNISSESSLQYEVYEPYNKTKLNLSICENTTIDIYIPVILSERLQNLYEELKDLGYDLFDINSPFYQDICTPYKSTNGTDIILSDRINDIYYNDETFCQSNCKFSDYLMESQYLKCDCDIKNSQINTQETEKFSAKSIYESFFNVLKYSNYKVLKCSKLIFTIYSLTKNIGSIISIMYFLIFLVFFTIYIIKGITQLKVEINKTIKKNLEKQSLNKRPNYIENEKKENFISFKEIKYKQNTKIKHIIPENLIARNVKKKRKPIQFIIFTYPPKKKFEYKEREIDSKTKFNSSKEKDKIGINNNINILVTKKDTSINISNKYEKLNEKKKINKQIFDIMIMNTKEKEELDVYEINNLEFEEAKIIDKRNFFEIYWSLLKREHLIIFTFITKDDHNLMFIKYASFIFLLCTDMAMNVFFFSDETMHKMYLDYGNYNFIQQVPQIVYSTIISKLIETILCYLSLTDKHYYQIKECKKISKRSLIGIMKCIQIKIGFFFGFTSVMFIFYWYLICCFCAAYQNTQVAFIKDSLLSFLLGNIIPFGIYAITSLLRIIALKTKRYRLEWVYALSSIIPLF